VLLSNAAHSCCAHSGHFPGFPEPPAGSRTPTLGKQKAGAGAAGSGVGPAGVGARGRKASKASGRLFSTDNSTPRYLTCTGHVGVWHVHAGHKQPACKASTAATAPATVLVATSRLHSRLARHGWAVSRRASGYGGVPVACFACFAGAAHASRLHPLKRQHHWGGKTQTRCSSLA
jgi:hypothetical protein